MKRLFLFMFSACLLTLQAATYTPATVPDPKQFGQDSYVSNPDGILNDSDVAYINAVCRMLEDSTDVEMAVVVIEDKGDYEMFDFGFELFQRWGIGKEGKNTGVLVTFALASHNVFINTGTGIEGVLTDALCSNTVNTVMIPRFKEEDYGGGLCLGVTRIYELCSANGVPEELLNMTSVTNRGGYTALNAPESIAEKYWWLWVSLFTFLTLFPFLLIVLYQGKSQPMAAEDKQRSGCLKAMAICCIFWPFLLPALIWFIVRSRRFRCPNCGKQRFRISNRKTIKESTYSSEGLRAVTYTCKHCGYSETKEVPIAKMTYSSSGGDYSSGSSYSSGGSSYSGGSSSGSWGGGSSSGGGAGGSW